MKRILMSMAAAVAGLALAGSVQAGGYDWCHGSHGWYPSWNYSKTWCKTYGYGSWKGTTGVVTAPVPGGVPAGPAVVATTTPPVAAAPAAVAPAAAPARPR